MKRIILVFALISLTINIQNFGQWPKHIIEDNMTTTVSVDVADLDGDTKLDLLVTNGGSNQIILYLNDFPQWNRTIIDNVMAPFAYTGDIDGDDTLDIVACLYMERKMVWYENNLPAGWTQHIIAENTNWNDYVVVVDLNNDNKLDVVSAVTTSHYNHIGDIVWYENNHPTWTPHIIESNVSGCGYINVTDIDADGLQDVVVTMDKESKVVWFKSSSIGTPFEEWNEYTIDDSLRYAWIVNNGDVNGDGKMDIVATAGGPYYNGSDVVWYENDHPNWTRHVIDTDLPGANFAEVTDVDGDGIMDVIAGGFAVDDVVWYKNNHPTWKKNIIDENLIGPRIFALADLDDDEIDDLIVPGLNEVVWYKNPYVTTHDQQWTIYNTSNSGLPENAISCVTIDKLGNKWIGTDGSGLANFNDYEWIVYDTLNSDLPSNWVDHIVIDDTNNKWIGNEIHHGRYGIGNGLTKFDGNNWISYYPSNSDMPDNSILSLATDDSCYKWIGTSEGLVKFDGINWTVYNTSNSDLPDDDIGCIAIDDECYKWIGTRYGLTKFNGTDWINYNSSNSGLPNGIVYCISIDNLNNKWIATFDWDSFTGGFVKFDGTDWTNYNIPDLGFINCITIDNFGDIWIGTRKGLAKFNGTDWTIFDTSNSGLSSNNISCLTIDELSNMWIGTSYDGLVVFNEDGVVSVDEVVKTILPIPHNFNLLQNYPNPFNPSTKISYSIPNQSHVSLKVFDVLGREVSTLINKEQPQGNYEVEFNASNLTSGIYFYRIQAADFFETKKMILMK